MELTRREIELVLGEMKKDHRLNNAVWRAYHENELLYMNTGSYQFYEPTTLEVYLEWNGKGIVLVKEFLESHERQIELKNEHIRGLAIDLIEEVNKEVGATHGVDFEMSDLALEVKEFIVNNLI